MKVVLASSNAGKLRELADLLAPLGIELASQQELHIDGAEETGLTFVENALAKARHASRISGLPAIADDSGISLTALAGRPGVFSARYAGEGATDDDNNKKLMAELNGVADTSAHYDCVIVYLRHPGDPAPLIASGTWHGTIIREPRGSNGFGYDPYFLVPGTELTAAELSSEQKNQLSHRGRAVARLLDALNRSGELTDGG